MYIKNYTNKINDYVYKYICLYVYIYDYVDI